MDVNERIQNMLSERIDTLEAVVVASARQVEALHTYLNVMETVRLNETEHGAATEDTRRQVREIVAVLKAATR